MNILVTAGNTQVSIDKVRCLTNIFTGRTGTRIALDAYRRGHQVTLLTSHPEVVDDLRQEDLAPERWTVHPYRTFEDLDLSMGQLISAGQIDAMVHSAAVSDYLFQGVYGPAPGTIFHSIDGTWRTQEPGPPAMLDRGAGKVKSNEPELWLRLVRAPKLIDRVRKEWGFSGVVVKFKLEVGVSEDELLAIAERSRAHSNADLIVANTLEGAASWALLGPLHNQYQKLVRGDLSPRLIDAVESLYAARDRKLQHG